jgi:hypothetical protein
MNDKYKKWDALEKECAAEEAAEQNAKKGERDRRKAERQQQQQPPSKTGDPIRDAYESAFENKKGEMKITQDVSFVCHCIAMKILTAIAFFSGGAEVQESVQRPEIPRPDERLHGRDI